MLVHPTDRNLLGMVHCGMISNCLVTANTVTTLTKSSALTLQE
jgi:hypothetical protein